MNKINLIKNEIEDIINSNIVKAMFSIDSINDNNDCTIDLYFLINSEQFIVAYNYIDSLISQYNVLIFNKKYEYNNYVKVSYYFENSINVNLYYLYDLNIKIYNDIIVFYDPYELLNSLKISKLPYTNLEFAKNIDNFCVLLFDFYKSILADDKLLAYNTSLKIQSKFVLIYRGFYDSLHAKKEFTDAHLTMNKNAYSNLIEKIKLLKFDTYADAVEEYIKEVDVIIEKIPVNIIALFNIDFYTFTKKLIFTV